MSGDGDSGDTRCMSDRYRDDQPERQRYAEQHSGGDAERSDTHRVAAPRALEHEDKQTKSGRSHHAMHQAQKRRSLTTQIQQRQGHTQRHRRRQRPCSGADYANTPRPRSRAMSSAA